MPCVLPKCCPLNHQVKFTDPALCTISVPQVKSPVQHLWGFVCLAMLSRELVFVACPAVLLSGKGGEKDAELLSPGEALSCVLYAPGTAWPSWVHRNPLRKARLLAGRLWGIHEHPQREFPVCFPY